MNKKQKDNIAARINDAVSVYKEVFDGCRRNDYRSLGELCETVQAAYGTGGNNTPIVVEVIDNELPTDNRND